MASFPSYHAINYILSFTSIGFLLMTSSGHSFCHRGERLALLQFKQTFVIRYSSSEDSTSYPKTVSWGKDEKSDCCLWDGVECDEVSGHVIGLDLRSSCLYGSIDSNGSLFNLVHLQHLHLGDNNFTFSRLPSEIERLTRLTYLNLSHSVFFGEIPTKIADFSNLSVLDLGGNVHYYSDLHVAKGLLKLDYFVLRKLVLRSVGLEILDLHNVHISTLPYFKGNLSSLSYLNLKKCQISGQIPSSLGLLKNLGYLDLRGNNLSGQIPSSLANLTQLTVLSLSCNSFSKAGKLSWLSTLYKLRYLHLYRTNLEDKIPIALRNLTHLRLLDLGRNNLIGEIPSWLSNVSELSSMSFYFNHLHGQIPKSITKLSKLEVLALCSNTLSGTINLEMFSDLKHLVVLSLSFNKLLVSVSKNASFPMFQQLELCYYNLRKFPEFLRYQDRLLSLEMCGNQIHGQIPSWIVNKSAKTLSYLELSDNHLTAFEQPYLLSSLTHLSVVSLDQNNLEGPLPTTSSSVLSYTTSHNFFSGEIPESFCKLRSLTYLDLSYNNLSGKIPSCLGNSSVSLLAMSLASNLLHGSIPSTFTNESSLKMIDLNHNQLRGRLPKQLANCRMLELLDISENNIVDEFSFWLGALSNLEVLILGSNQFFGSLKPHTSMFDFPSLRIIDLSSNHFKGSLPFEFFQNLSNMISHRNQFTYMMANRTLLLVEKGKNTTDLYTEDYYKYKMTLRNKGADVKYEVIPNVIVTIDLSDNMFQGEIPPSLVMLSMVNVLNLSNNNFSGRIPSAIANMTSLESLDLSLNNLSGEIPPQLAKLNFLEYFNVSNNQLVGAIPNGNQFNTFDNNSYMDNPGLCGEPLKKKYQNSKLLEASYPTAKTNEDNSSLLKFGWKVVAMGYGSGVVVGVVLGHMFATWKHTWLMKTFRIKQPAKERRRCSF